MSEAAIRTAGLSRRFGEILAVDGLDLTVPQGEVTGFLGPNGAGKTTALRMILGLIRPDAGRVELFGRPLETHREAALSRIGALVETPSLYPHLTGRENLAVTRCMLGLAPESGERVLTIVQLADAADRRVDEYSLGMRQRLGLGLALLAEPELLILDEPTNGLDPAGIQEMRELVRDLPREHGVSVLLSSHLLAEVEQVAQRVVILDRGRCRFQGPLAKLHAARRGRIRVGVDHAGEAAAHLRAEGWQSTAEGDALHIEASGREIRGEICRILVAAGFVVHHLSEESSTLEAAFLELTESASEAVGADSAGSAS